MVHSVCKLTIAPLVKCYVRNVTGLEHLPKPPFIVAANHSSYLDDVIVPVLFITHFDTAMHIFVNSRYYKNFFLRKFLYHYDCIPVDVSKDVPDKDKRTKTNEAAFAKAAKALQQGNLFGIFPEGSRSPDGKLRKAKLGVARVALENKVPVVPVGVIGSYEIMPKGAAFPKFKRADIHIGKPLDFRSVYGKQDPKTLELVTRNIMREIAKLSKQEYPW